MKPFVKHGIFLFATVLAMNTTTAKADEVSPADTGSSVSDTAATAATEVTVGNPTNSVSDLKTDDTAGSTEPSITSVDVTGGVDPSATGVDFFKGIEINLEGTSLTDDNFLNKDGLHWSDKTYTELIQGAETGLLNDAERFGESNTPTTPVTAYRTNVGDSGRINFVGKTRSGIDLDLLWTVVGSDQDEWAANSGYNDSRPKGLGFAGEQFIPGAAGNSIAVLYNNASNLALHYQIVKHGTTIEQPIIVSFISTDIDAAQGVQTNLANLVEMIPTESNLVKKDGIIYDATSGVIGLNGSKDLPKGGYLGAGFLSNFDYTFYSPAPERVNDSYYYPIAVRYDIFGSSLQANINTRVSKPIVVQYVDNQGTELKETEYYKGFDDETYRVEFLNIPNYRLVDVKKAFENQGRTIIQFIYQKELPVTLRFQDEAGKELSPPVTYKTLEGQRLRHRPKAIEGYITPEIVDILVDQAIERVVVYKKVQQPKHSAQPSTTVTNQNTTTNSQPTVRTVAVSPNTPTAPFSGQNTTPITQRQGALSGQIAQDKPKPHEKATKPSPKPDPFLTNTRMTADEKRAFLAYIKAVGDEARQKYGKDQDKVNHAIANAIARVPYADSLLQRATNDFGKPPAAYNESIKKLLMAIHESETYPIDFPHLAAPLATSYPSGFFKEVGKFFAGISPLNLFGLSPKEVLFQNNSLTGDLLTTIDDKDTRTDIDAFILRYHPDFRDLDLDRAIEKYYHTPNLDQKRQDYYFQTLKEQSGDTTAEGYKDFLLVGSIASLSGLALMGIKKLKDTGSFVKRLATNPIETLKTDVWQPLKDQVTAFFKHPLKFIEKTITAPIGNALGTLGSASLYISAKALKTAHTKLVKPAVTFISNKVIKPVASVLSAASDKVIKPVYKHVIKPAVDFMTPKKPMLGKPKAIKPITKPIVRPARQTVIAPVYNHAIKPAAKAVNKTVIQPVYNKVIKPVAKAVNKAVIKPVYNHVIKPVYNHIVKPVVQPVYQKVVKPVAKAVNRHVVQPIKRTIVDPIKKRLSSKKGKRK